MTQIGVSWYWFTLERHPSLRVSMVLMRPIGLHLKSLWGNILPFFPCSICVEVYVSFSSKKESTLDVLWMLLLVECDTHLSGTRTIPYRQLSSRSPSINFSMAGCCCFWWFENFFMIFKCLIVCMYVCMLPKQGQQWIRTREWEDGRGRLLRWRI